LEKVQLIETRRHALAAIILLFALAGTATAHTITEFPIPMVADTIVAGSDGALWFAARDRNQDTIGRITTDGAVTSSRQASVFTNLAAGPDGALWFGLIRDILPPVGPLMAQPSIMSVGRITTAGVISEFHLPSVSYYFFGITAGPDGALWVTEFPHKKSIGRITTTGEINEFPLPSSVPPNVFRITAGPDGALWFADRFKNQIGRITTDGAVTEFTVVRSFGVADITAGPDGALWFTDSAKKQVGRITATGAVTKFRLPSTADVRVQRGMPGYWGITVGADGALWFTETPANTIGRLTTTGELTEFLLPTPNSNPAGITAGPDGAVWFTESGNNGGKIGRIERSNEDSTEHIQATEETTKEIQTAKEISTAGDTAIYRWGKWGLYLEIAASLVFIIERRLKPLRSLRLYSWLNRRAAMNKGMDTPAHSLVISNSCRDTTQTDDSWGWKFIDLAAFGINTRRSYFVALLRIVFYPLAFSALVVAAAIVTHQLLPLSPIAMVIGVFGPIIAAGVAVLQSVTRTHRRPWLSLVSARLTLDWKRLAIGAGVQVILTSAIMFLVPLITGQPWRVAPTPSVTLPVLTLAFLLTPLQAASEEILFRGYLTQALGRVFRSRYKIVVAVAMIFAVLHLNAYGPLTMPYMFAVSLIFSLTTLRDDRIELAVGAHTAQNCLAVVVSIDSLFYGQAVQITWPYL